MRWRALVCLAASLALLLTWLLLSWLALWDQGNDAVDSGAPSIAPTRHPGDPGGVVVGTAADASVSVEASDPRPAAELPITEQPVAAQPSDRPGAAVLLSGWLVSPSGQRLSDHFVQLRPAQGLEQDPVRVRRAQSSGDGRFTLERADPGLVELSVLGPDDGDVWGNDWLDATQNDSEEPMRQVDEGRITLTLPTSGLQDVTLVVEAHPAFWVSGTLQGLQEPPPGLDRVRDVVRDVSGRWFAGTGGAWLEAPGETVAGWEQRHDLPEHPPIGLGPVIPIGKRLGVWWGGDEFVARAERPRDSRLVVEVGWHRTIVVDLDGAPTGGFVDAGVLHTEPVGRIAVHLLDASTGQQAQHATLSAECRGGDRASAPGEVQWLPESHARVVVTDRSHGTCEPRAEAPGYVPLLRTVELAPFLDLELDLLLERTPP